MSPRDQHYLGGKSVLEWLSYLDFFTKKDLKWMEGVCSEMQIREFLSLSLAWGQRNKNVLMVFKFSLYQIAQHFEKCHVFRAVFSEPQQQRHKVGKGECAGRSSTTLCSESLRAPVLSPPIPREKAPPQIGIPAAAAAATCPRTTFSSNPQMVTLWGQWSL